MQKYQAKTSQKTRPFMSRPIKIITLLIILAVGIAYRFSNPDDLLANVQQQSPLRYALIGDIGGTNIRYRLVSFLASEKLPFEVIKEERMKVKDYETFQASISAFLSGLNPIAYPDVAVIAMAGPINKNTVSLPNVQKWGQLNGSLLTTKLNVSQFLFINDFQAASYGLLIVQESEFVQLNNKTVDGQKIRGVIGPGTGLGHSIIFNNPLVEDGIIVLPSEAGHSDLPYIDKESMEYVEFLKQSLGQDYIDLEKAFCGPSLPYMFQFYSKSHGITEQFKNFTSEDIVFNIMKNNTGVVYEKVFEQFMKFYSSAIANFMIQHMTTGGVYLVGGLTKALVNKFLGTDILKEWKLRHPDMTKLINEVPLIFCNQVDLGLKGAFVMANRLVKKVKKVKIENNSVEYIF